MNSNLKESILNSRPCCVYGLGTTGKSVVNFIRKRTDSKYYVWDDYINLKKRIEKKIFVKKLDSVDFIVMSPGISLKKAKLKKALIRNKHKIITDLDLFYIFNPRIKSIVVTGTNGKSTTCKILNHILKKNKINVSLGGNIGTPILNLNLKKKPLTIIEASSFQLAYSKFVKPDYAIILNITNDHLDWHYSVRDYYNSKFKIFSNQNKNDFSFVNNKILLKKYKKEKYKGKMKFVNINKYKKVKKLIKNEYLSSEANEQNMSFIYVLSKILKIEEKSLINSIKSFKGLPHRQEVFYKKKNIVAINDSKATSFEASKFALKNNENIFWIIGGLPKKNDKFQLRDLKKNIIKGYVIGKNMEIFKKHLKGEINYQLCATIKKALISIFEDTKKIKDKKITILLSPSSASYDQFRNFEERGNYFKKLMIKKFKGI